MPVELHLPDLPEVPISLGPPAYAGANRRRTPWHLRLRDLLSAYLPLLLMTLLALATWWLVRHTPSAGGAEEAPAGRIDPDYTMTQFAIERFDADGRLKVRIEGDRLRHFPATDRLEAEGVRIRALSPDGRVTLASAQRAISNGDGSEVQLVGGARVVSDDGSGVTLEMSGEFLHVFLVAERVRSHLPVQVKQGATELRAAGLEYDHGKRRLDLKGPLRAVFAPKAAAR
ncbi:MAG: LPS export ABC transporter periplasmic protein LptC [Rubrivivax sp.]